MKQLPHAKQPFKGKSASLNSMEECSFPNRTDAGKSTTFKGKNPWNAFTRKPFNNSYFASLRIDEVHNNQNVTKVGNNDGCPDVGQILSNKDKLYTSDLSKKLTRPLLHY